MDALTFLYFALGGTVIVLGIFLVIVLIQLIRILKDIADVTDDTKEMVTEVKQNVSKISEKIIYTTDQILTYIIKPIYLTQNALEKLKPILDFLQKRGVITEENSEIEATEEEKPKRKRTTKRKNK